MAKKIFVTGGAGFIGSNFVQYLLGKSDDQVTVFDALTYAGNPKNLSGLESHSGLTFIKGDVTDREALSSAMQGHDWVVHFAAESHVDRSISGPDVFLMTNCVGTGVVCDVARMLQVQRVLHVGTDEVYGSVEEGCSSETDYLEPRSPYSASKAGADLIALSFHSTWELPVVVTRSSNQFGPYQYPEKVIPLFITNLLDGLKVPLYGDGLNVRDWMHVMDNCRALDLLLREGKPGEIYNVGGGNEITNRDLTERIVKLCEADESSIEYVDDRLGHDRRYSVDCSKIKSLGWRPETDFDAALEATVEWYRQNRNWWEPLKKRN